MVERHPIRPPEPPPRAAPGEPRFPDLKAIARLEALTERNGQITRARRFLLSSLPLGETLLAHWGGIENRLHWVLDVVFHDDLMRLRTDNGPKNMPTIKPMAINLLRSASGTDSLKLRAKISRMDHKYPKALITRTAQ